jgi:hypothetical protein
MFEIMRSSVLLVCFVILLATAFAVAEDEDYLDVIGPSGTMTGANYSVYGSAFEEFMGSAPVERNLSSYPDYLIEFLDKGPGRTVTNYSLYSPAFEDFMNLSKEGRQNVSSYPAYLSRFLSQSPDAIRTNYSLYSPAFEDFMNLSKEGRQNVSSYPAYLSRFLN